MKTRYYVSCIEGRCVATFQAVPIKSFGGPCSRRDIVESIDARLGDYLSRLTVAAQPNAHGLFELRFEYSWWRYEESGTYEHFKKNLLEHYLARQEDVDLEAIPVTVVTAELNRYTGRTWIAQLPVGSSVDAKRQEILDESHSRYVRAALGVATCWAVVALLIAALIYSVRAFFAGVASPTGQTRARRIIVPLVFQCALLCGAVFGGSYLGLLFACEALLLLVPAVPVAWLVEGWWVFRHRRAMRVAAPG